MNEQLIKFIELCLVDGVISDKEREVIFRKSKELGVPDDECEIILDGLIQKLGKKESSNHKSDITESVDETKLDTSSKKNKVDFTDFISNHFSKKGVFGRRFILDLEKTFKSINNKWYVEDNVREVIEPLTDKIIFKFSHSFVVGEDFLISVESGKKVPLLMVNDFELKDGKKSGFFHDDEWFGDFPSMDNEGGKELFLNFKDYINESLNPKDTPKPLKEIPDSELIDINTREVLNEYFELIEKSKSVEKFWSKLNRFKKLSGEDVNRIKVDFNISHNFVSDLFFEKKTGWYFSKSGKILFTFGKQGLKSSFKSKYYIHECLSGVPEIKSVGNFLKKTHSIELGYEMYIGVHDINHTNSLLQEYNDYLQDRAKFPYEGLLEKYEHLKEMGELRNKILIKYNNDEIAQLKKYPDDINLIVRKHQNKFSNKESLNLVQVKDRLGEIVKELDHLYKLIGNYDLRNSSPSKKTGGIIIPDEKNHYLISELINEFEEGVYNYSQIHYYTLCMITSIVEGDKITFMEIYLKFDKMGIFNSNWENNMLEGVVSIGDKIDDLIRSVNIMNSSISSKLDSLYHLTESSFQGLQETVSSELKSINSSVNFNNLLTGIQTYQMYKVNKNTKSLRK